MAEPVFRGGVWWQQQDDGTWLRWNDGTSSWEPSPSPPPDDASSLPPPPPMPGTGLPGGPGQYGSSAGANVPTYLVWSILTTLLCCLPAGVVAIVYSSQVSTKLAAGDHAGAVDSSNKARTWCIVSAAAGIVAGIIWFAVVAGSDGNTTFS